MNLAAFERAQVAAFAFREARYTGSLDCMKAVCYVVSNRVKAGWGDGSWLAVLEAAHGVRGNIDDEQEQPMQSSDRLLQLMVRDIDDIYLGQVFFGDPIHRVVCGEEPKDARAALYYTFVDRKPRQWFVDNVIRRPQEHPQVGNVGPMMLFR